MNKDCSAVINLAKQYNCATGAWVCVLDSEDQEIYSKPESWLLPVDRPFSSTRDLDLQISFSGRVLWRAFVRKKDQILASVIAGVRTNSSSIFSDIWKTSLVLEDNDNERSRLLGLSELLNLSCEGLSSRISLRPIDGNISLSGVFSQVEGFSLSSRLLCAIRMDDGERVRFFLERIGKALWQVEKVELSRRLAISLLIGLRDSLGLSSEEGSYFQDDLKEVFNPSSLALWMDRVIKSWRPKGLENNRRQKFGELRIFRAKSYLRENFRKNMSLSEVAKELNLSQEYFSRLFKEQVGKGFVDYLSILRVDEAKRLLEHSHKSLSEIAGLCGFKDQSYFTKIFKKYEKINPREYRRKLD